MYFLKSFLGVTSDYSIQVNGRNTIYSNEYIESKYIYEMNHCEVDHQTKRVNIIPRKHQYDFRTKRQVQRTGVMLVGWGGNNGSTITGATIANRDNLTWMRKGINTKFLSFMRYDFNFIQRVNNIQIIMVH